MGFVKMITTKSGFSAKTNLFCGFVQQKSQHMMLSAITSSQRGGEGAPFPSAISIFTRYGLIMGAAANSGLRKIFQTCL
jgi:hypothetical protein